MKLVIEGSETDIGCTARGPCPELASHRSGLPDEINSRAMEAVYNGVVQASNDKPDEATAEIWRMVTAKALTYQFET